MPASCRNATPSDLIVCAFNNKGETLTSNDRHAEMLARQPAQIVGQNWREWTVPSQLSASEQTFERCLAGEAVGFTRLINRPDGSFAIGRSQLFPVHLPSGLIVVGTMQFVLATADLVQANALDVAEYVGALSDELAKMANGAGLKQLGGKLERVVSEAGEIATLLNGTVGRKH